MQDQLCKLIAGFPILVPHIIEHCVEDCAWTTFYLHQVSTEEILFLCLNHICRNLSLVYPLRSKMPSILPGSSLPSLPWFALTFWNDMPYMALGLYFHGLGAWARACALCILFAIQLCHLQSQLDKGSYTRPKELNENISVMNLIVQASLMGQQRGKVDILENHRM